MKPYHILLVEDDRTILNHNRRRLEKEGYRVAIAMNIAEARQRLREHTPDLIVLDILLPDGSGLDLCRDLHGLGSVSVLFLTCLADSDQVIQGLRAGGDDYIVKPYRMEELLARIEAQLRRTALLRQSAAEAGGPLRLDEINHRAYWKDHDLLLSPKEFQLLALLMRTRNRYATADELYTAVWGLAVCEDPRTVTSHIYSLRKKLESTAGQHHATIENIRMRGYRLILRGEEPHG